MVQTYRELLQCEALRDSVFLGKTSPLVFGEPEEWIALLLEALRLEADSDYGQSAELRAKALGCLDLVYTAGIPANEWVNRNQRGAAAG